MTSPRHAPQPPPSRSPVARAPRRSDVVVRQRLRAVAGGARPALAWHPATEAVEVVRGEEPERPRVATEPGPNGWLPARPDALAGTGTGDGAASRAERQDDPLPDLAGEGDDRSAADALGLRARRRAATTVAHAYAAAHGHPTTHSGFAALDTSDEAVEPGVRRLRTGVAVRVAVAGSLLVLVLGGVTAALTLRPEPVAALAQVDEGPTPEVDEHSGEAGTGSTTDAAVGAHGDTAGAAHGGTTDAGTGTSSAADPSSASAAAVVVHVVGQVAAPGLVSVPVGARVADALTAAGGASPDADLTALNLARTVVDGEQIVVPRPGEAVAVAPSAPGTAAGTTAPGSATGTAAGPVDLNAADAATLDGLPGIGPVLAERIVAWRDANGRFTSVDELGEVSGIGPATLTDLRDLVRV